MNRFKISIVILAIVAAANCNTVFADSFTPLDFSGATYNSETTTENSLIAVQSETKPVQPVVTNTTGNQNMQSAISQLDNAQVEVRNDLMKYKTKYTEIDTKYNAIKQERAELSKQIKTCEKKIRQLDKAKEKIRKNME